jgi:hypothetical protein
MDDNHHIWHIWARTLHRWGVSHLAASLLDAAGPVTLLGAQAVYLGQPLLRGIIPATHLNALAGLLEDGAQTRAFAAFLREEQPS